MSVLSVLSQFTGRQSLSSVEETVMRLPSVRFKQFIDSFSKVGLVPDKIPLGFGWQNTLQRWFKAAARRDLTIGKFTAKQVLNAAERDSKATTWLYGTLGSQWKRLFNFSADGFKRAQQLLPNHSVLSPVHYGHQQFELLFRNLAGKDWLTKLLGMATVYGPFYGLVHPTHFAAYLPLAWARGITSLPVAFRRSQKAQIENLIKIAEKKAESIAQQQALASLSPEAAKKILRLDISH